ncbi:squalene/phytoene synthase family protein [Stappia sp. F7233]|uniref:Squalene/phytoene synthase family protein n=1 Tax=Stappia albiluteola TaxID=2758565 RepID=A0A839ABE1_9HYPH|nr:phytoene/squalene synthase family protein [Stappia albiluteola]MBA5776741.1 squalene/phytoene synthase family protein [Stappia albiluteola]
MQGADKHCQELVREADRDRYLSALFAPEEPRRALMALYAFNAEVARIREIVSDPLPGEIRLQWWRDVLEGNGHGETEHHPVAAEVLRAIERYNLPVKALTNLIDARIFDLYDDPMPSLTDLEGYAGETSSSLIQLGAIILARGEDPGTAEIAGHAGVAYALTGLMRALPIHASRRQMYLPADLIAKYGVDQESVFRGETSKELKALLGELRTKALDHLLQTRSMIAAVPRCVVPAFLPVCLVEPHLRNLEKNGYDPLRNISEISQLKRQWFLWRAWRKASKVAV